MNKVRRKASDPAQRLPGGSASASAASQDRDPSSALRILGDDHVPAQGAANGANHADESPMPMASRASTDLVRQERDLQRLRAAIEVTADAIFLIDPASMAIVCVNAAACELSGYLRAELLSISPGTLFSSPRETLQAAWQALIDGDQASPAFEALHRRADGAHLAVQVRRHAVRVEMAWLIVHVARDITMSSRVEQALQLVGIAGFLPILRTGSVR